MSRGELSSEQKAEHATPKSTPTPGISFGGASTSLAAIPKETSHPEDGGVGEGGVPHHTNQGPVPPEADPADARDPDLGALPRQVPHLGGLSGEAEAQTGTSLLEARSPVGKRRVSPVGKGSLHVPHDLVGPLGGEDPHPVEALAQLVDHHP